VGEHGLRGKEIDRPRWGFFRAGKTAKEMRRKKKRGDIGPFILCPWGERAA